ncbi:hypothetical protein GCM10017557_33430 [Streptomyces aurantiacus]|uniref:Uncharacterized protein n=1 Tax=Streptomyces aurantiacus TaxID=47760 RepID=A0A7G1P3S0_9ACTN|nr:hypothetical protein GCM10017557_33430 [Streptomyces aurantiacus]
MSRARSSLVNDTSAILATGMPCADNSTIWARRHVTTVQARSAARGATHAADSHEVNVVSAWVSSASY